MDLNPSAEFVGDNPKSFEKDIKSAFQFEQDDDKEYTTHKKMPPGKWHRKSSKLKRASLLAPSEIEVFNITSNAKPKREEHREIPDVPLLKDDPQSVWDALGIMKTIRQSFFDNFFSPIFGNK